MGVRWEFRQAGPEIPQGGWEAGRTTRAFVRETGKIEVGEIGMARDESHERRRGAERQGRWGNREEEQAHGREEVGGIRRCDGMEENLRSVEVGEYRKWRAENREIGRDLSGR